MQIKLMCCVAAAAAACATASVAQEVLLPPAASLAIAGLSGMTAWLVVHPGDVIKTRMQLESKKYTNDGDTVPSRNAVVIAQEMIKEEGASSLYGGLSAALARQATYTTLRLGLYDIAMAWATAFADRNAFGKLAKAGVKLVVGAITGGIAALASCPIEVCLVRMQADGKLPPNKRRNYRNILDALIRIGKEEGVKTYWTGVETTVIRAMVVSVTQVATYDQAKEALQDKFKGSALHLAAGVIAAAVFCTASMPFDTVKTREQQASKCSGIKKLNPFRAINKLRKEEGLRALWNGFPPYLASKGILTVLLFIIKEKYTKLALVSYGLPNPVADLAVKH